MLPTAPPEKEKAGTQGDQATGFRPSKLERETGFEPATLSLGNGFTGSPATDKASQALGTAGDRYGSGVQPSQPEQMLLRGFATPLLRDSGSVMGRPPGHLLTVREAARLLRVSTATVYKLCARGELGHVRVLNALRIPERGLDSLRSVGRRPSR